MARTRQDLITLVLENLGVLAAGQAAAIEDRDTVNRRIDLKLAELAKREVITGLSADALDDGVFLYVADVVGYACRVPFGVTGQKADLLTKAAQDAETTLRAIARQYSATAATDAFDVVRDALERLGVVAPGQDPSAQDRGVVAARIAPMLSDLKAREVVWLTDLASADPAQKRHLAAVLAAAVAPAFGAAGDPLARFLGAAAASERALRIQARQFDAGSATSGVFDVAQATLELLGVVEGGQTASTKDRQVVSARFAPTIADLRARRIIDLASVATADQATQHLLSLILAARCAPLFGVDEPRLTGLRADEARAEAGLRDLARQLDSGIGTGAALDAAQAALEALGVVTAGQSASVKDRAVVNARMASVLADLRNREVLDVASFATADASAQPHLIAILTARVAPLFATEPARLQVFAVEADRAEAALRVISRQLDTGVATGGTFDLIQVVLENLGAVSVGRTATDKDRAIVTGRVKAVLDDLRNREVIDLPSLAGANPSTLLQLSVILTSACAMAFGVPADVRQGLRAEAGLAEAALQRQTRQLDTGSATNGTFDLAQSVLEMLGVVAGGQSATAKDRSVVAARVPVLLADLRRRDVVDLASVEAADPAAKLHLAALLAFRCGRLFGLPDAMVAGLKAEAQEAEAALRLIARQLDSGIGTGGTFDLVQSVLETLGVVSAGQTASTKDAAVVSARVDSTLADLRQREVINLASLSSADPGTLPHLAAVLSGRCAPLFGWAGDRLAAVKAEAVAAEGSLRRIARQLDTGSATGGALDVVQSVLESLGVVEAGQTCSAKDRAVVSARVAPMLADLRQREIVAFVSLANADPSALIHLAAILALACAVPFKVPAAGLPPLQAAATQAEAALRVIGRQLDTGVATGGVFDVVQAVLENLGVVIAGYTGSTKDRAVVSARVAPVLADLKLREVAAIDTIDTAHPATLIHLATILTSACSQSFGIGADVRAFLAGEAAKAETALKALARQLDTGTATTTVFDPVQAALEMIGVVTAGQSASEKDRAVVHARVQPVLFDLRGRDICGVTDLSELSIALQSAFAKILAAECAASFADVPPARVAWLEAKVPAAEQALRYQSFLYDALPPMRIEPFWGRRLGSRVW